MYEDTFEYRFDTTALLKCARLGLVGLFKLQAYTAGQGGNFPAVFYSPRHPPRIFGKIFPPFGKFLFAFQKMTCN